MSVFQFYFTLLYYKVRLKLTYPPASFPSTPPTSSLLLLPSYTQSSFGVFSSCPAPARCPPWLRPIPSLTPQAPATLVFLKPASVLLVATVRQSSPAAFCWLSSV